MKNCIVKVILSLFFLSFKLYYGIILFSLLIINDSTTDIFCRIIDFTSNYAKTLTVPNHAKECILFLRKWSSGILLNFNVH